MENPILVTLPDGDEYTINHQVQNVDIKMQDVQQKVNLSILPIDTTMILGNQWLSQTNPQINWRERIMKIIDQDQTHTIQVDGGQPEKKKLNFIFVSESQMRIEEGDTLYIINRREDTQEELGIDDEYYARQREEVNDPELEALLKEYKDIFREELPIIEQDREHQHYIHLKEGAIPKRMPQYRLSPEHQQEIQETMKELLRQRYIRRSQSPWNVPLIVMKKKDGTYHVVIDYHYLNSVIKPQGYRMKDTYEMLERLAGKKFLSAIDLLKGYYHIGVAEECRYLTAFHIPGPEGGNFKCVTMLFGLRDAPPTFQQFMDEVFKDILADFAIIYMDDLGAGSETREEHLGHLRQTFEIMRENQLYAKKKKCYFMQKRIPFLGYFVSEAGIEMNPEKIEAVKAWPSIKMIK